MHSHLSKRFGNKLADTRWNKFIFIVYFWFFRFIILCMKFLSLTNVLFIRTIRLMYFQPDFYITRQFFVAIFISFRCVFLFIIFIFIYLFIVMDIFFSIFFGALCFILGQFVVDFNLIIEFYLCIALLKGFNFIFFIFSLKRNLKKKMWLF